MGGMCQDHWDRLREAVDQRGLSALIAEDGRAAATKMRRELEEGLTIDTFEPLMFAANSILVNAMETIGPPSSLYLLTDSQDPEDPVEGYGEKYKGRTWSRCPLCYINLAHEVSCEGCDLSKETGFDFWIDKAADGALERWKELGRAR